MPGQAITERQHLAEILITIRRVQQQMQLVRWPPALYGRTYGKRSVEQILRSKSTNYMNPCLDLTIVLLHYLREKKYKPTLIVEELISEHTGKPTLHFALEIPVGEKVFTVDFPRSKTANFYEGKYDHLKAYPHLLAIAQHEVPTETFTPKTKPFRLVGVSSLRQIGKRFQRVRYAHIRKAYEMMRRADRPELLNAVRARPLRTVWTKHKHKH